MKIPNAPHGLKGPGKKFWKQSHSKFELDTGHDLERLFMACRCLDEIAEDEKVIEAEGRFVEDRFHQKRLHPAAKSIQDNKIIFCRIVRELGLDLENGPDSRLPGRY